MYIISGDGDIMAKQHRMISEFSGIVEDWEVYLALLPVQEPSVYGTHCQKKLFMVPVYTLLGCALYSLLSFA